MKTEKLQHEIAIDKAKTLPFALIRTFEDVYLGKTPENIDFHKIIDAKFFNENTEIRFFMKNGLQNSVLIKTEPNDDCLIATYNLDNNKKFGNRLTVKRILSADEDGQAYIALTCLSKWEE